MTSPGRALDETVIVAAGPVTLEGALSVPAGASGLVLFAHGSGSSRHSPRNTFVARALQASGVGTLLLDLLTEREDDTYATRFDIGLLTRRLVDATQWARAQPATRELRLGYFGASTGAAAALDAAAELQDEIAAVVSRGGRPDLAQALGRVRQPTVLLVGERDRDVLRLNRDAYRELRSIDKELIVVRGASHLFEERGALEEVARLAADWFVRHLRRAPA